MKIGIYTNLNKDINALAAKSLIKVLDMKGVEYAFIKTNNEKIDIELNAKDLNEVSKELDLIIAFGGDGTMISIVSLINDSNLPVLGVNLGKIGFLSEVDVNALEMAVDKLVNKEFFIEKRTLLELNINNKNYYALNEVILGSAINEQISAVSINIDDSYADTVRCDGVIVSTPTGSTAYSLSCNGPILSPSVKALIINTICPHTLRSLPMVISDDSKVVLSSKTPKMKLMIDGRTITVFGKECRIEIKKSSKNALFIRFNEENFYQKLLKKLSYWGD